MNNDQKISIEVIKTSPPPHSYFKTLSAVLGVFVLVTGLGIAVRLSQQKQETRTKADASLPSPTLIELFTPVGKIGDANNDGRVDGADYTAWLLHYGETTAKKALDGDFNEDGRVDGIDYSIWLLNYL
jgi:hypothetical protein